MKNILSILADAGVELTDEQKKTVEDGVKENYKPVADWQKQVDKVKTLENDLSNTREKLKAFDGVDTEALNQKIAELQADLDKKDSDYQAQIADRDFHDMLKESIATAKGKNAKAITALLDVDVLKASKNQKEDITAALKALAEAEDSKMLFGEPEDEEVGAGDPIGTVTKKGDNSEYASLRAAMGLPEESKK